MLSSFISGRPNSSRAIQVRGVRLDTFLAASGVERVDVVKLDFEGSKPNIVSDGSAPVSIRIHVHSRQTVGHRRFAVLLHDSRGFLISGWSFDSFRRTPGENDVQLSFLCFPLRPGAYSLNFSIHDEHGQNHNWTLVSALVIEGVPVTHFIDEWAGVLNIPCSLECKELGKRENE